MIPCTVALLFLSAYTSCITLILSSYIIFVSARVRSTTGGYFFSLSTIGGGGTPCPSHNTSTGPMSFLGGTPVLMGVPHSGGTPPARSEWDTSPARDGVPPPPPPLIGYAWTVYAACGTPLADCLVHPART